MSATNETTNVELSQFLGTDIPSWLSDYNGDMLKIDGAFGTTNTLLKNVAPAAFSNLETYELGTFVTYEGKMYKCISDVTSAGAFVSTDWQQIDTGEALKDLDDRINTNATAIDDCEDDITSINSSLGNYYIGTKAEVLTNANANDIYRNGFYRMVTPTNFPSGLNGGMLTVFTVDDTVVQEIDNKNSSEIYRRTGKFSGSGTALKPTTLAWNAWQRLATSEDLSSLIAVKTYIVENVSVSADGSWADKSILLDGYVPVFCTVQTNNNNVIATRVDQDAWATVSGGHPYAYIRALNGQATTVNVSFRVVYIKSGGYLTKL